MGTVTEPSGVRTLRPVTLVYVNGGLFEERDAVISVFDHGLTTGDGVFESILVTGGRTFALRRHLDRLERSATIIGLAMPPRDELGTAVAAVVASSEWSEAKVRITVTGGSGPLGSARVEGPPTVIVALTPLAPVAVDDDGEGGGGGTPAAESPRGARVAIAPWPRTDLGPSAGAKTISYVENVVALAWAHRQGASEALFANLAGDICEGTGSNLFLGLGARLITPPLRSGCLAGVTRSLVIELTGAEEADLPVGSLSDVTEAFLTATSRGVQPIEWLGDRHVPECPGPLTLNAAEAYAHLVASDLDP